ncbi:cellulase [Streptomyces tuirus]|uniref:Cellulase n=1 Tax=Streptomyces tuirus TaxID=68278 RepID=A0A941FH17_9ACTN|nr:cellulase [Streptomyces tuirus]
MDDFERNLSRLMRDTQRHTPYEPEHRQRLHAGIRARRRSRMLWKAGGSAVAVAGLSVGLALLPNMLTRAQPADHDRRPQPATSPTPSQDSAPTFDSPDPSPTPTRPASSAPATSTGSSTPSGSTIPPTTYAPTASASESRIATMLPAPPPSSTPTTVPPSAPETKEPSASAGTE